MRTIGLGNSQVGTTPRESIESIGSRSSQKKAERDDQGPGRPEPRGGEMKHTKGPP